MNSLKIILVALFSIVLLTGVNTSSDSEKSTEKTNKEVNKVHLDLTTMKDRRKVRLPSQG